MKIDTVADVEAYIAGKRVMDEFLQRLNESKRIMERNFLREMARLEKLRDEAKS